MKSVVLDGFAVNPGDLSWDFLFKFGDYKIYDKSEGNTIAERIGDADIVLTNRAVISRETVEKCPNLKFITTLGTGFDMIDTAACREHGIEVCNVPGYSTNSVSQWAFTLMLALTTDLDRFRNIVKEGKWTGIPGVAYQTIKFSELSGKTVGIYGCGAIGSNLGKMCRAFGMRVLGYRRSKCNTVEDGIEYTDKNYLIENSDFISFHCPLTDETTGLVNDEFLSKMKKGAYLINTSRGAVIDEDALAKALCDGRLSGAAIDVMQKEPPAPDNKLLSLENCIITPHCAWVAPEARARLLQTVSDNIESFVKTGKGIYRIL